MIICTRLDPLDDHLQVANDPLDDYLKEARSFG